MTNTEQFLRIAQGMAGSYEKKDAAYGNSFHVSVQKYGLIAALTRISDKFNRMENLILNNADANDESLEDTLLDLASYCIMTVMESKQNYD